MRVTRVSRIKGYRLFRDFCWPSDLHAFGRFNLIYGWNGTGKTSLAALFRNLQDKTPVATGEVVFEIDDRPIKGSELPDAVLPPVRVFNREFVAAAVSISEGNVAPIYFLGQDSVEKQRQIEKLKKELGLADRLLADARSQDAAASRALDDFCITRAKLIKELLISSHSTSYNNYDKRRFREAAERLNPQSQQAALLQASEKARLRSKKDAQPKAVLPIVTCEVPDFDGVKTSTDGLLRCSVVSQVIDALASDREVGIWVRQGLALHTGARTTDECRFCGQRIPPARLATLEAHFNDAFSRFQAGIDTLAADVDSQRKRLMEVTLPESSRLYDHLAHELDAALAKVRAQIIPAAAYLESLHTRLVAKRESPFSPQELDEPAIPNQDALSKAIAAVNEVIEKHNSTTTRFRHEVEAACQELEQCLVAEGYEDFLRLVRATETASAVATAATTKTQGLRDQIATVEREVVEHRRPAEQINAELRAYLGHDELRFDVKETGYTLTRNGQPASNLSEGEKTAIAFLYFLKSLQDKSFDLPSGVVVIDDPVSSLDANALFSAFGFMKECTKLAGQLFVLTHNFGFFRQVKNWYHFVNRSKAPKAERPLARFFLLRAAGDGSERRAVLGPMDSVLEEYDSEYHYIFKRVYTEARQGTSGAPLEASYGMPNIARRLLEAFLSFRFPDSTGDLYKQLEVVPFDPVRKTRILRFVHTHSHHGHVAEPEHDPSALSETSAVLGDVLALIEATDGEHFRGMMRLVTSSAEGEAT